MLPIGLIVLCLALMLVTLLWRAMASKIANGTG